MSGMQASSMSENRLSRTFEWRRRMRYAASQYWQNSPNCLLQKSTFYKMVQIGIATGYAKSIIFTSFFLLQIIEFDAAKKFAKKNNYWPNEFLPAPISEMNMFPVYKKKKIAVSASERTHTFRYNFWPNFISMSGFIESDCADPLFKRYLLLIFEFSNVTAFWINAKINRKRWCLQPLGTKSKQNYWVKTREDQLSHKG